MQPQMRPLLLTENLLTLNTIRDVAVLGRKVELTSNARNKIKESESFLRAEAKSGKTLYGVNTGFGQLSNMRVPAQDLETLQVNLLRSHAVGVGPYLPDPLVRAMLLLRAQALALGHSGVTVELVEQILNFLNQGICPLVPEQGSVGASGDLAPLAHLALVLIGEGRARLHGKEMSGAGALRATGLKPLRLKPKEGIALINGTQFMTAIGALTWLEAEHLCNIADLAGAMTLEALRGSATPFLPEIHKLRPHPGQALSAKHILHFLTFGEKSKIARSHENCDKVQDAYSLRCMPQVHGACRDTLKFVRDVLEREINSVTDNPLVFPSEKKILNGGNFHGEIVAIALDALAIAAAELASISERRIEKLTNPALSGLPAFLTKNSGLNSGFMIVQVAAASLVSENKTLCHPASVDSLPTSADKEDHVSMGAWAARKSAQVVTNTRRVLAMELLAGAQGIDLLRPLRSSTAIEKLHKFLRSKVKRLDEDRSMHEDIQKIEKLLADFELAPSVAMPHSS